MHIILTRRRIMAKLRRYTAKVYTYYFCEFYNNTYLLQVVLIIKNGGTKVTSALVVYRNRLRRTRNDREIKSYMSATATTTTMMIGSNKTKKK